MSKYILYVNFDGAIMQWQNEDDHSYGEPPEGMSRQEITTEQYEMRGDPAWYIGGEITSVAPPPPDIPDAPAEELAVLARRERDGLLKSVYDPAINKALRAQRLAKSAEDKAKALAVILELDAYAEALTKVPGQNGFPRLIDWPILQVK